MALAKHSTTSHTPTQLGCDLACAQAFTPELAQELQSLGGPRLASLRHQLSPEQLLHPPRNGFARPRWTLVTQVRVATISVCDGDEPRRQADSHASVIARGIPLP